jgi:hypothetical protein
MKVYVVPPNARNTTAVTGSGTVYDGTGLDEDINWFGPIKVIATTLRRAHNGPCRVYYLFLSTILVRILTASILIVSPTTVHEKFKMWGIFFVCNYSGVTISWGPARIGRSLVKVGFTHFILLFDYPI